MRHIFLPKWRFSFYLFLKNQRISRIKFVLSRLYSWLSSVIHEIPKVFWTFKIFQINTFVHFTHTISAKIRQRLPRSKPAVSAVRPFHFRQLYFILEGLFRNPPSIIVRQKKCKSSKVFFKLFPKSHHFLIFIFRIFPYFSWLYPFLTQCILNDTFNIQILNVFWTFKKS